MKFIMKNYVLPALFAVALFFAIQMTLVQIVVHQSSMMPGIEDGQHMFLSKVAYWSNGPERGDIIVFRPPYDLESIPLIKRVVGLPGETVEIRNGSVYINDVSIDEPYIYEPVAYEMDEVLIDEQSYFVLGDNRNTSRDSHNGWQVSRETIIGKAWVTIWPPRLWGKAPNHSFPEE